MRKLRIVPTGEQGWAIYFTAVLLVQTVAGVWLFSGGVFRTMADLMFFGVLWVLNALYTSGAWYDVYKIGLLRHLDTQTLAQQERIKADCLEAYEAVMARLDQYGASGDTIIRVSGDEERHLKELAKTMGVDVNTVLWQAVHHLADKVTRTKLQGVKPVELPKQ